MSRDQRSDAGWAPPPLPPSPPTGAVVVVVVSVGAVVSTGEVVVGAVVGAVGCVDGMLDGVGSTDALGEPLGVAELEDEGRPVGPTGR
ncbi:hypothetical protein B0E53_07021 [Micromonospora sp. MH33]|uniref:hypothetical protein n=1 Tax=Micromonospora sp. MH33 TaxID=1945509 RepID=UPI000D2C018B|nr:hypothetical protein [Micromonospora sp. MH33]PSK57274.1 hypothetical protein B0E53_07021 [Micromonospora sp. MH33]